MTSVRIPALNEFAAAQPCPLRIDDGSLDIDTAGLPQGQHSVRILLEDAAGNRTTIFGPLTRNITTSGAIGPGSDPALRGAANGDGAGDLAQLSAHWGRRGSRTLLVQPLRSHPRRPRAPADRGRRADRQRGHRRGLEDDRGQRARAEQERRAADPQRRLVVPRASAERLLARRDLPLPQPCQRHDRVGDGERAVARAGRLAPGDPSAPGVAGSGDPLQRPSARRPAAAGWQAGRAHGACQPRRVGALQRRAHRPPRALSHALPLPAAGGGGVQVPRAQPQRSGVSLPRGRLEHREGAQGLESRRRDSNP